MVQLPSRPSRLRLTAAEERLIAAVAAGPSPSLAELSRRSGVPYHTVRDALSRLVSLGLVSKDAIPRGQVHPRIVLDDASGVMLTRLESSILALLRERRDLRSCRAVASAAGCAAYSAWRVITRLRAAGLLGSVAGPSPDLPDGLDLAAMCREYVAEDRRLRERRAASKKSP